MNLDRFDLNLLVAFEALMTEGQVTRAARRLHITQPALSSALARLRTAFNDQLYVTDGISMRPTLRVAAEGRTRRTKHRSTIFSLARRSPRALR